MPIELSRAKDLFLAALELPAGERSVYLDSACGDDLALRQRVDAMLRTHENSGELLQRSPAEMLADSGSTEADATAAFAQQMEASATHVDSPGGEGDDLSFLTPSSQPGHLGRLGHYEIQEIIGKGGFGIVLKAFDERLHRVVAIKVLSPAYAASGAARKRFIREARTAAAVKNEHVVGIHDVQEDAQPPFLVMEMIDGVSLQDKIDKHGPLGIKEILRIGTQMAEGLAAAHKQGLVHRDIKPANILLENGVERVKITDFGLARAVDDASVTQSGTVAGTPMYMSPEQAEGLPIDHRSDLFSLGTVLYAMCTGHPPFRASGTHAVLKRVIDASPRPIREINNEVPEWLEAIIAKLHAKKPEDRFATANEVAELLGQHLAHLQQPNVAPLPAGVVAPGPAAKAGTLDLLLESSDTTKRLLQHGGLTIALVLALVAASSSTLIHLPGHLGIILLVIAIILGLVVSQIKQRWVVTYRGHRIRFENSCFTGETLFIDDRLAARGGVGLRNEVRAVIPNGEGAGEEIVVFAESGLFSFHCRIVVEHSPAPERSARLAFASRMQRWLLAGSAAAVLVLLAAGIGTLLYLRHYPDFAVTLTMDDSDTVVRIWPTAQTEPSVNLAGPVEILGKPTHVIRNTARAELALPAGNYWLAAELDGQEVHRVFMKIRPDSLSVNYQDQFGPNFRWVRKEIRGRPWNMPIPAAANLVQREKAKFHGQWHAISGENGGNAIPKEMVESVNFRLRFAADRVTVQIHETPETKPINKEGGFTFDPRQKPATLDLIDAIDGKTMLCIYRWDGDKLRLCGSPKERPDDFTTKPGSERMLFVLKRVPSTDRKDDPGWVQLFNGKDLTGWKRPANKPGNWQVVNGMLVGSDATTYLFSERAVYQNFHLHVQAAINQGGYGGVYFRLPDSALPTDGNIPKGYFAQINSSRTDVNRTGSLFGNHLQPFVVVTGKTDPPRPDEWFDMEVIADGRVITIKVNGKTAVETIDTRGEHLVGHLALMGIDDKTIVKFRKVEIKKLPSDEPGWVKLFNGKDLDGWVNRAGQPAAWKVADGELEVVPEQGDIMTAKEFGPDFELHAEFNIPLQADKQGQDRGNSGLFLLGRYEIQILDSFDNPQPAQKSCAALFGLIGPSRNVCKPPGEWQTLDVTFHAPRLDGSKKVVQSGELSVMHNGVLVIDKGQFDSNTGYSHLTDVASSGPIMLQSRGSAVRFRNLRLRPLPKPAAGFVPLFDGKDLTGWTGDTATWAWKDGKLVGDTKGIAGPFRDCCLLSKQRFRDFELKFRARTYNPAGIYHGIYLRCQANGTGAAASCQGPDVAIGKNIGGFYSVGGIGKYLKQPKNKEKLLELAANNAFNDFHVRCVAKNVTITVNGMTVIDDDFPNIPDEGLIAFHVLRFPEPQNWQKAEFADIQIRQLSPAEPGWVPLFNGKDLTGWNQPLGKGEWKVIANVLTGSAKAGEYGILPTLRGYSNFHLRAQVRLTGPGNSGIVFRTENGYQVEIDAGTTGSIARSKPFAWLERKLHTLVEPGSWCDLELIAAGPKLTSKVNGQVVASVVDNSAARGYIALEADGRDRGPMLVEFRKIEIKELPSEKSAAKPVRPRPRPIPTAEIAPKYRASIAKGLAYLAKAQHADGHWEAEGGQHATSMTALAGMAMLMEGSTLQDGAHAEALRKAVDWMMAQSQPDGKLSTKGEASIYMFAHGYGMLFLATVYGQEEDGERKRKLERILAKAVEFTGTTQTKRGGWGYVSATDGNHFDESASTIAQLQALRAARNAGIVVPRKLIDADYLRQCTTPKGGVIYSITFKDRNERPPLTAAALAAGEYDSDLAKRWFKYCQTNIPGTDKDAIKYEEYTQYHFAQALYILGDKGYEKLFPDSKPAERLTWSSYRAKMFDAIIARQKYDGSWRTGPIGDVYSTACWLTVLQLDNGAVPIYQR